MIQYKTVAYYTLGCKLNFSETSTIARQLTEHGCARVEMHANPDIFVLNTCSVTENADKKCRQIVKKVMQQNPATYVIVIGCYAQLKPTEISEIPGVDLVLGANEKFNIPSYLTDATPKGDVTVVNENIKQTKEFVPSHSMGDRTRSFLKIQDGCDYFCTFCTIPLARGKSRNASIAETLEEAHKIARTEVNEIVLTGVNIGDFGQGGEETFEQLIHALDQVEGIDRFRISSIEPNLLSDSIIQFCLEKSQRFVPHFHIPLQSGSDTLLKAMRRKYLSALYADRVNAIKKRNPKTCIGVDVIVGFPGETDEEFMTTYNFLNDLPISYLHVFTYSERANTTAIKMDEAVPQSKRKDRSRMLHILSDKKKRAFYESVVGDEATVLIENSEENGYMFGFTENYVKVKLTYRADWENTLKRVKLSEIDRDGVMKVEILEEVHS
jgi:threonylcarbamoyladenosine tRNA methylthiotransferase MtaB